MPKRKQASAKQPDAGQRQRVYAACSQCRRRKRKCNGNRPCASCAEYGYDCTYEEESANGERQDVEVRVSRRIADANSRLASGSVASLPRSQHGKLVISEERGRFIKAASAVALPHIVARNLCDQTPLRLHSFAWHLGIRPLQQGSRPEELSEHLSLQECHQLSVKYFSTIHPLFAFLSEEAYWRRLDKHWPSLQAQGDFAAVVAGVSALGSFFSTPCHPQEANIKRCCFQFLDLTFSAQVTPVTLDSVAGWILRTLYARLTARPAISTLASHTTMHLVDVLSLQRDISEDESISVSEGVQITTAEMESRQQHYWAACSLNRLLSAEYGLTAVELSDANCKPLEHSDAGICIHNLASLGQLLQPLNDGLENDIGNRLQRIRDMAVSLKVVSLFKADVSLCMLRLMLSRGSPPPAELIDMAVVILREGLDACHELTNERQPWWNIVGVPFQTICVGLLLDNEEFLELLVTAMRVLQHVADAYVSPMTQEALQNAHRLVGLSKEETTSKLTLKDTILAQTEPRLAADWNSLGPHTDSLWDNWPFEVDFESFSVIP